MKCPGQDMQYWESDAIFDVNCPECDHPVEFYKDDTTRKCGQCGHRFVNPRMDFGCAAYCKYAEQCLGTLPEEFIGAQDTLLKDKVAVEMKRFYKTDFKKIRQVSRIAQHAEKIGKDEGANIGIILCAAYLQDIGSEQALERHESQETQYIRQESLVIATEMLKRLGSNEQVLEDVCNLIKIHHTEEAKHVPESKILSDAELTAHLEEQHKSGTIESEAIQDCLASEFLTDGGRKNAQDYFTNLGVLPA